MKISSSFALPVNSIEARPVKNASQFQPARSREGQSMNPSTAFSANVRRAASNILLMSASDDSNFAFLASGFTYSRMESPETLHFPPKKTSFP